MSNLVLHAIVMKKPRFSSKDEAYKEAKMNFKEHLKNKKFVRETNNSYRVRVHPKTQFLKTTFVSKKINPDITLVFGKPNERFIGGSISTEELGKFVESSYKKKSDAQNVDGYQLDKSLSTKRDKIYTNDQGKVIHTIAGTDSLKDWSNNLLIPFGLHTKSNRYKNSERIQKEANKKYNTKVDVVSHSQSGNIANNLQKRGLVGEDNVTLNPAILGSHKGVSVVRSSGDLVSSLTKKEKGDKTIKSKTWNPLTEHSTDILKRINPKKLF
jgi:hypothetical protein